MSQERQVKKLKIEDDQVENLLEDFEYVKVLSEDNKGKIIRILAMCKKDNSKQAVIIFEKPHFSIEETKSLLDIKSHQEIQLLNDIYKKFSIFPTRPYNSKFLL